MKLIKPNILSATDGSFSRASTGSYTNSLGGIATASVNTPRFHYINGEFKGLLYEPAMTNNIPSSEVLVASTGTTVSSNTELAPDGTTTADELVETTANSEHYPQDFFYVFSTPTTYTWSAFVKRPTGLNCRVALRTTQGYAIFDFTAKAFVFRSNGIANLGFETLSNDYYRIWIVASSTVSTFFRIQLVNSSNALTYAGSTSEKVLIWGRQMEISDKVSSYIKTSGSAATRSADVITGSGFIYSDAVNADANYSSATTYALAARVTYLGSIWESLQNTNLNHQPDTSPTWWILIGPDNKHAVLDSSVSTVSSNTGELILVVKPGAINSCGLVDIDGTVVEFGMTDVTDGFIFNQTVGLASGDIYNWYDYFFVSPLLDLKRTQVIFYNLPEQYTDPIVSIKISNGIDLAKLALAAFGNLHELGNVQYGASAGIVDYSVKATDEFGTTTLLQRNYSKRLSAKVILENRDINRVQRLLYSIRATPVVWIGVDDPTYEEAMILWGFYKDFTTEISYPSFALCSVEIEGLA